MYAKVGDCALDLVARNAVWKDQERAVALVGIAIVVVPIGEARHGLGVGLLHDGDLAACLTLPNLGLRLVTAQQRIDDVGDVLMNREAVAVVNLDDNVESRRRFALEHGL